MYEVTYSGVPSVFDVENPMLTKKKKTIKKYKKENDDDRLEIVQQNPKIAGSMAYHRYEVYKSATTQKEYFEKGGTKEDFKHDQKKGFVKVLD